MGKFFKKVPKHGQQGEIGQGDEKYDHARLTMILQLVDSFLLSFIIFSISFFVFGFLSLNKKKIWLLTIDSRH